jgi:phage terminase large subunit GpA-like protein
MDIPEWFRETLARWRPTERIGGAEWAERFRKLGADESAARVGDWVSLPWQRQILDDLADPSLQRIVIMKAAQVGASELVRCAIGRWALYDPGDVLWVMADRPAAEKAMKKLRAMFANTPSLRPLVSTKRGDSTLLEMRLTTGMRVVIGWAGSASSLASDPFRYVVLDETSKYRWHVQGEGSPIGLAEERTKTFGRRGKIILLSTPKNDDDLICKSHRETLERFVFEVPCACGHLQVAEIEALRWPGGDVERSPSDPDARVRMAAAVSRGQTAWIECASCRGKIQPHVAMHAPAARWRLEEPAEGDGRRGYHIPEWIHWQTTASDLGARWLRCTHPKEVSEFWNGSLGLPYKAASSTFAATIFERRAVHPDGLVPSWATAILATADTQADHFWLMIRAWGAGGRSRLLDWGKVASFEHLRQRALLNRFPVEGGGTAAARFLMIDSGAGMARQDGSRTHDVYQFAKNAPHVIAAKGVGDQDVVDGKPIRSTQVVWTPPGKTATTFDLQLLHGEYWKDAAAALIRSDAPVLWEESASAAAPEYGRQLTGEQKVMITLPDGSTYWRWQKRSKHAPEHLWDCAWMQVAAAEIAQVNGEKPIAVRVAKKKTKPPEPRRARMPDGRPYHVGRR